MLHNTIKGIDMVYKPGNPRSAKLTMSKEKENVIQTPQKDPWFSFPHYAALCLSKSKNRVEQKAFLLP